MIYALIISTFFVLFLRDAMAEPLLGDVPPLWAAAGTLGSLLMLWLAAHAMMWRQARRLDRTGNMRTLRTADRAAAILRIGAVLVHALGVLALGWLDAVRAAIGDVVALDELLAVLPVLIVFALSWWSMYPLERRLRDALILRDLEHRGEDAHAEKPQTVGPMSPISRIPPTAVRSMMPGRTAFVISALRHQVALVFVPVALIITWKELVEHGAAHISPPPWLPVALVQFAGIAMVLTMMPMVLRRIWDTVAMPPGPLREEITGMCREHSVRIRELLVWRTHGTMVNGAVMGIAWPFRYILLTDALLDHLHPRQVQAVTAHEVAHVRCRHMPWLLASAIATIIPVTAALHIGLSLVAGNWLSANFVANTAAVGALGMVFIVFGFVSRRFEWQADAFAVKHLSQMPAPHVQRQEPCDTPTAHEPPPVHDHGQQRITAEAVVAMSSALDAVAYLNHMRREKFTWRHGSIASRQQRLRALVGQPVTRLKADRDAATIKILAAVGLILAVVLIVIDLL